MTGALLDADWIGTVAGLLVVGATVAFVLLNVVDHLRWRRRTSRKRRGGSIR